MRQWRLSNPKVGREGGANPSTFILENYLVIFAEIFTYYTYVTYYAYVSYNTFVAFSTYVTYETFVTYHT
jgi:hypothetical protein